MPWFGRTFTGIVSTFVESAEELRIHRTRVLLSLVGVAIAVFALTTVLGAAAVAQQALNESNERNSGRPAMLSANVYSTSTDGAVVDQQSTTAAWRDVVARHGIEYESRVGYGALTAQFVDGVTQVDSTVVDADYGIMHRTPMQEGAWFDEGDADRLAPALVVNVPFWQSLGSPALATHPTVELRATDGPVTAVVIGVVRTSDYETYPRSFVLADAVERLGLVGPNENGYQYEAWVPVEVGDALAERLRAELQSAVPGAQADVYRQDSLSWGGDDPLLVLKLVVAGVAVVILLLGALGLVTISLVTVKYRIREIGIRRSFGATSGRVFFSVMMESVVGTAVAGGIGVALAIVAVKSPLFEQLVGQGMVEDFPPFPIEAALIGIGSSVLVGALAGLLPALTAVRVRVIDAIRF
ncbi:putative ABC transport system permease protein [Agromyces sp. CF514]|uniref:ABC transporter permease n=1 Tax=Agromyces sp. CF514 TaxID=1881031 RepID=UPI0008EF9881|nr:ABC transporter permease [Agromyces sp. CF514]SFR88581.1 putative ABC transport system permease protein [Agromyces sp. CF514]